MPSITTTSSTAVNPESMSNELVVSRDESPDHTDDAAVTKAATMENSSTITTSIHTAPNLARPNPAEPDFAAPNLVGPDFVAPNLTTPNTTAPNLTDIDQLQSASSLVSYPNICSQSYSHTYTVLHDDIQLRTPVPRSSAPRSSGPRSSAPRSSARRSSAPRSSAPRSSAPRSSAPRSSAPRSSAPRSSAPHSSAPRSSAPRYSAPRSTAPRSSAPHSSAPLPIMDYPSGSILCIPLYPNFPDDDTDVEEYSTINQAQL